MTPQERELIADLFDRLAQLEREPRDADAERTIREGLARAPNAVYALVQSVLVQDEALKAADNHIADLEAQLDSGQRRPQGQRGFLDNVRDSIFGSDEPRRGSVPSVGDRPMGAPSGSGGGRADPWAQAREAPQYRDQGYGGPGDGGPGYGGAQRGGPMGGGGMMGGGGGFLGTAAAVAAGAIGGGLMMGGIRSALGGSGGSGSPASGAFDQLARGGSGGAAGGELSRDAGLNDIGKSGGQRFSQAEADRQQDADQDQDDEQDAADGDFDGDDSGEE